MKKNEELVSKVKDLLIMYEGKIIEDDKGVKIISNNELKENKKVECEVSFGYLKCEKYPYCVDASEKTYSILGGRGCPCENEKEVLERLERNLIDFKFIRKGYVQLSLFDL